MQDGPVAPDGRTVVRLHPATPERRQRRRSLLIRVLLTLTVVLGGNYLAWRWLVSTDWAAWPIAVPLLLAETCVVVGVVLFGATLWRVQEHAAPPPPQGATVDVVVTTGDEPVDAVLRTAIAAARIRYPHETWVLDGGARPHLRAAVEAAGIGYLVRCADAQDQPRRTEVGDLHDAVAATSGEFLLVLDAGQTPRPAVLDEVLGWFRDARVALVQLPQHVTGAHDTSAPSLPGPVRQGGDRSSAASRRSAAAVLRREALLRTGVTGPVRDVERSVRTSLALADAALRSARRGAREQGPAAIEAVGYLRRAVDRARRHLAAGEPASAVTDRFQQHVDHAARTLVAASRSALTADLAPRRGLLEAGSAALAAISLTGDVATAMRLQSKGWRTVQHRGALAGGPALEDGEQSVPPALRPPQPVVQQGAEQPFTWPELARAQTPTSAMAWWGRLSDFAAVGYLAVLLTCTLLGAEPVIAPDRGFFGRLLPFLVAGQLLLSVGWRMRAGGTSSSPPPLSSEGSVRAAPGPAAAPPVRAPRS